MSYTIREATMTAGVQIDWSQCPSVEVNRRVQSGAPVLRGTRLPVSAIVDNYDYGMSSAEISEQFQVPLERVEAILAYAKSHRVAHSI
jgi:uncharacterized protein (DUF433 family)